MCPSTIVKNFGLQFKGKGISADWLSRLCGLSTAEGTGSPVFHALWSHISSYVSETKVAWNERFHEYESGKEWYAQWYRRRNREMRVRLMHPDAVLFKLDHLTTGQTWTLGIDTILGRFLTFENSKWIKLTTLCQNGWVFLRQTNYLGTLNRSTLMPLLRPNIFIVVILVSYVVTTIKQEDLIATIQFEFIW